MHHRPCWARMIAVFNRACFSDTRTGVQVLSTTRARLKLLPRVIPFPACSLPFWQLSVLSPGSRHPSRTAPLKDVRPSHRHPCWLGRLPPPRGTQIWGGEVCQEREAELSGLRLQHRPLPTPPTGSYLCSFKPSPGAVFLPSPLSRSLHALSPLSGSFTAQSVIN